LDADGLAVIPTETVYGLAAPATQAGLAELARVRERLQPGGPPRPAAWHAPSVEAAAKVLEPLHPTHRRLLQRMAPGPVTLVFEQAPDQLAAVRSRLALAEGLDGAIQDSQSTLVRIPTHPKAIEVLAAAKRPIVAVSIPLPDGGVAVDAAGAARALAGAGVSVPVLDAGRSEIGKPSAVLRLLASGRYLLASPGIYDEAYVRRRLARTVLFVCTGNTCRSPMAEAIARGLQPEQLGGLPVEFHSAGVAAFDGASYSPETVSAVRKLGMDAPRGSSKALTPAMIAQADAIFAMTQSHRAAVLSMDPGAGSKVRLLDPSGLDVADPIGHPQARYDQVAAMMREMIRARLAELDA
jgi:protein-tyrosine phosphatase